MHGNLDMLCLRFDVALMVAIPTTAPRDFFFGSFRMLTFHEHSCCLKINQSVPRPSERCCCY